MILNKMVLFFNCCVLSLFLITEATPIPKTIKEDKVKTRGLDQKEFAEMERCVRKLKANLSKEHGKPMDETEVEDTLFDDIAVTLNQCQQLTAKFRGNSGRRKRKAKDLDFKPYYKWDLPIKYYIDTTYFSAANIKMIDDSFGVWQKKTCLRFTKIFTSNETTEKHLKITGENSGCWSYVGQITSLNAQPINLKPAGCLYYIGTPIHEIAHALGFHHEQSRKDRDEYVSINTENIRRGASNNFKKATDTAHHNVPYDYGSVMQYHRMSFSTNNLPTIEPLFPQYKYTLGQRVQASFMDVTLMNRNYQCWSSDDDAPDKCKNSSITCFNGGHPNPGNNTKCDSCTCPSGFKGNCKEVADSSPGCSPMQKIIPVTSTNEYCLSSPNYGSSIYQAGDSCTWLLEAPVGGKISFRFDSTQGFGIYYYPYSGGICYFHWVEIRYNGNLTETGARYCGSNYYNALNSKDKLVSTSEQVLVDFRSEYRVAHSIMKGFKLCYRLTEEVTTLPPSTTTTTTLPPSTTTTTTLPPSTTTTTTLPPSTTTTTTVPPSTTTTTVPPSTTTTTVPPSTTTTTVPPSTTTTTVPRSTTTTTVPRSTTTTVPPSTTTTKVPRPT